MLAPTSDDLRARLLAHPDFSDADRAALVQLLDQQRRYGLVWEDKPEAVEETLRQYLPVLEEVPARALNAGQPDVPQHTLIEGDNLHALTVLSYTHAAQVDVIYIDPPYNTGNKDFIYNDRFVDREDGYRHSKWLSFMAKRLKIAKILLKEAGVIFISIDDNEQAQLKLLCDEVFGEENFVGNIIWNNVTDNNPTNIASEHEYVFCYAKNKQLISPEWKSTNDDAKKTLLEIGDSLTKEFQDQEKLQKAYTSWFKEHKSALGQLDRYKYIDQEGVYTGSQSVHNPGKEGYRYDVMHPITKKACKQPLMGYRFPKATMDRMLSEGRILFGKDESKLIEIKVYAKDYLSKLSSILKLDGRIGANQLRDIFENEKNFNNPKPIDLVKRLLDFSSHTDALILDFFAGSGTTLHATMALNAGDGGRRRCILVTNNENNICEQVTYERNRRVIQGYNTSKGVPISGLAANALRYYRCVAPVPRTPTPRHKRQLVRRATDLLCLKEACYSPLPGLPAGGDVVAFGSPCATTVIVYDDLAVEDAVAFVAALPVPPAAPTGRSWCAVYVFAAASYAYEEEFAEVADRVHLSALPEALYRAWQQLLPPEGVMRAIENDASDAAPAVPAAPTSPDDSPSAPTEATAPTGLGTPAEATIAEMTPKTDKRGNLHLF